MKACIVSAATIAKHGRMDAGFYCSLVGGDALDQAIDRTVARIEAAQQRLIELRQQKQEHGRRIAQMIRDGEIRPL